jgi:signal transduction histidine kinase/FixJ family two-component response regulator
MLVPHLARSPERASVTAGVAVFMASFGGLFGGAIAFVFLEPLYASLVGVLCALVVGFGAFAWCRRHLLGPLGALAAAAKSGVASPRSGVEELDLVGEALQRCQRDLLLAQDEIRSLQHHLAANEDRRDDALRAALDAAREAGKTKNEFLAKLSHELRTPLNGVIGAIEAARLGPLPVETRKFLDIAISAARHQVSMVDRLIELTEAGESANGGQEDASELKQGGRGEALAIDAVLGSFAALWRPRAEAKNLSFRLDTRGAAEVVCHLDWPAIELVLGALTDNAIRFSSRGTVTLTAEVLAEDVHGHGNGLLRLRVTDEGPGVPASLKPIVFDVFSQGDNSSTRRHGGLGLGLAEAARCVKRLGGTLDCLDAAMGACFEARIPVTTLHAPGMPVPVADLSTPAAPAEADASVTTRVLVVEDNEVNRLVLASLLESAGFAFDVATDGRQAVNSWFTHRHELILMDCQMPVMDGFQATASIRSIEAVEKRGHVPIIAVTANAVPGDRERCLSAGMDDYLAKPFIRDTLLDTIGRWIGVRKQAAAQENAGVIDMNRILELRNAESAGVPGLVGEVISTFLGSAPGLIEQVESGLRLRDSERVRHAAHRLKSGAAQLGLSQLADTAVKLETLARMGKASAAQMEDLAAMRDRFREACGALRSIA